ncbi:hypothetical protein HMI54_003549 [Coelomomyces lativittatus]|nr:hypothetical protein HMI55_001622 [Coelomomyces lativittatus]KAJ1512372.1 hypothetical protein HMI56_004148 [Coelomomyces lativittatus]KAJ1517889.1 hypothetical protein HMI54_003549 [Coelomomyces lativittatus]
MILNRPFSWLLKPSFPYLLSTFILKPSSTVRFAFLLRSQSTKASDFSSPDSSSSSAPPIHVFQHPTLYVPPTTSDLPTLLKAWIKWSRLKYKTSLFSSQPVSEILRAFQTQLPTFPSMTIPQWFVAFQQHWLTFLAQSHPDPVQFKTLCQLADLRFPENQFPEVRQFKREIIMHVGPTNSGKTHQALNILENAKTGAYCGPLRLLAKEVYEKLKQRGTPCNLITGEERHESPDARFTSYTVEMLSFSKHFDVVVIDEIQMLGDPQRGWAWCQALLGVKASTVILCGEASSVPLVQALCSKLNEPVTVHTYDRLGPLRISNASLNGQLTKVQKGDCVIVFSRDHVFTYQKRIQDATGLRCAVVYGSLPPECRASQANLFNSEDYDVLVSTDAIGMGLNLKIQRIVITSMEKYNGSSIIPLALSTVKQIAGRAGRFGHGSEIGWVTTLYPKDFKLLSSMFHDEIPTLQRAGLQPTPDQIESFCALLPNVELHEALKLFEAVSQIDLESYFLCTLDDVMDNAKELEGLNFPIRDRFLFTLGPVNTSCPIEKTFFNELASRFAAYEPTALPELLALTSLPFFELMKTPYSPESSLQFNPVSRVTELKMLEKAHRVSTFYLWLIHRFHSHPTLISSPEACLEILSNITQTISKSLETISKSQLRAKTSFGHSFPKKLTWVEQQHHFMKASRSSTKKKNKKIK